METKEMIRRLRSVYECFSDKQFKLITDALCVSNLNDHQLYIVANPSLSPSQMREVILGFTNNLSIEQVKLYANPSISPTSMSIIRKAYKEYPNKYIQMMIDNHDDIKILKQMSMYSTFIKINIELVLNKYKSKHRINKSISYSFDYRTGHLLIYLPVDKTFPKKYKIELLENISDIKDIDVIIQNTITDPKPIVYRKNAESVDNTPIMDGSLDSSIDYLNLSNRSHNCLRRAGIKTIRDLICRCEDTDNLLKIRNLGKVSANEIIDKLNEFFGFDKYSKI